MRIVKSRALRQAREFVECGLNGPAAFKRRLLRFMAANSANAPQSFLKAREAVTMHDYASSPVRRGAESSECGTALQLRTPPSKAFAAGGW